MLVLKNSLDSKLVKYTGITILSISRTLQVEINLVTYK